MQIRIEHVPFSRFGSYMTFSVLPREWGHKGLILRTMHGSGGRRESFRLALLRDGREVDYRVTATPSLCRLDADGGGRVEICFPAADQARLRGEGLALRLVSMQPKSPYAFPAGGGCWQVNCPPNGVHYLLGSVAGGMAMDAPHRVRTQDKRRKRSEPDRPAVIADFTPDADGRFEAAIQEFLTTPVKWDLARPFEDCLADAEAEWQAWAKATPTMPGRYAEGALHAMHVNYSAVVGPSGNLKRPTMLMSKNWMTHCWSWDHCFNAIALSYRNPDLAWDQLMVHFDLQDRAGALPDGVNAEDCGWSFCKPPIHGWALRKMMRNRSLLNDQRLKRIYPKLSRWTRWWLTSRDTDGDGLPSYHHGNDSGWDNGTVFDGGYPATAPDLSAFLVVQMDLLAELAQRLGRPKEVQRWRRRADALLQRLIEKLWTGEQFITRRAFSGEVHDAGDCLLNFMPIILGTRLPKAIRDAVAAGLAPGGRFVTDHGPATESPASPLYVPDGYWRGPIWGSETVLLIDGLWRGGYREQAREIARRYCEMCLACGLFAENYNALTGEPLRDKAYTWGSSAFLILAHEFLRESR